MKPEEQARQRIDLLLTQAGWLVQDYAQLNLGAGRGIAIREFPLSTDPTDYLLVLDRQAVGVVEAKKVGETLTGVEAQTKKMVFGRVKLARCLLFGEASLCTDSHRSVGMRV